MKLSTIVEHNTAKGFVDISDQKASYSSPVRCAVVSNGIGKIVAKLLTNTVVNAMIVFKEITGKNMMPQNFAKISFVVCWIWKIDQKMKI